VCRAFAFCCRLHDDRCRLAQRLCQRALCHSSFTRRIRCLDIGTQGCLEWCLLHAWAHCLCSLSAQTRSSFLPSTCVPPCARSSLEADARNVPVSSPAPGLLAPGPLCIFVFGKE